MASRSPCVTDTNVWIDLDIACLTDLIFRLPLNFQAPDVIVAELERPDGETLARRGLKVRELTGSQVLEVARLARRYLRPSRSDLFALVLARSQGATLLTGGALSRFASIPRLRLPAPRPLSRDSSPKENPASQGVPCL